MTPAQIEKIMALVESYADSTHISSHENCLAARAAVEAALRDAPQAEMVAGRSELAGHFLRDFGGKGFWQQCKEEMPGMTEPLYATPSAPTAVEPDERAVHQDDPELTPAAFADRLARHMQIASLTAKEVSELTGVSETTLSRLKNHGRMPDAISYAALCNFMGWHPHIKHRLAARASKGTPK